MTVFGRKLAALLGAAILLSSLTIYSLPSSSTAEKDIQKDVWTCGMHPQVQSDKPGKCPICGMTLVKKKKEPLEPLKATPTSERVENSIPEGHSAFQLSFDRQQMIGVKTAIVEKGPLFKTIKAVGKLAFDPELYTAQNEYVEAMRQVKSVRNSPLPEARQAAAHMVESSRIRLKVLGLADDQIARLEKKNAIDSSLLIAEGGGTAWIYAEIYESDLPLIRAGLDAEITADFLQGDSLTAKVNSVDRVIDPMVRTAKARIQLTKAPWNLRPQSYVNVGISVPLGSQVHVPLDAVFDTGTKSWVFLTDGNGHFEPRLVTIRTYAGDQVVIASGLKGGEKIVTSANFLIDSESRLKAVAEQGPKTPSCQNNEYWDTGMSMCMPKVGK